MVGQRGGRHLPTAEADAGAGEVLVWEEAVTGQVLVCDLPAEALTQGLRVNTPQTQRMISPIHENRIFVHINHHCLKHTILKLLLSLMLVEWFYTFVFWFCFDFWLSKGSEFLGKSPSHNKCNMINNMKLLF